MTNKFFLKYFIINYLLNFMYRNPSINEKSIDKKSFNENFSLQEIYNNNKTNVKILWLYLCNKLHTGIYFHVWLRMHVQSLVSQGTLWITYGRIPKLNEQYTTPLYCISSFEDTIYLFISSLCHFCKNYAIEIILFTMPIQYKIKISHSISLIYLLQRSIRIKNHLEYTLQKSWNGKST